MSLSGMQYKQLEEALIDAFPSTTSLERMLFYELHKNLRAIAGEGSLQDTVFTLIRTAISEGWIEDLVSAACNANPGNLPLKTIAGQLLERTPETHNFSSVTQTQSHQLPKIAGNQDNNYSQLSPEEIVKQIKSKAKCVWSENSGDLRYSEQYIVHARSVDIKLDNFILEAKFYNPYNGTDSQWMYGFSFRENNSELNTAQRQVYTVWISSNNEILALEGYGNRVEEKIPNLNVLENGFNQIQVLVFGQTAIVTINNFYTQKFDILDWMPPGKVYLVSMGSGNKFAKYESFKVWSILN